MHYYNLDSRNFIVLKNETFHHPRSGYQSRRYMWSCTMAGIHALEAYHHANNSDEQTLRDDGFIRFFMEKTNFPELAPRDDLAFGSTQWVLAKPSDSYVAYTYDYKENMGIRNLPAGTYDLLWFDTITGEIHEQAPRVEKWEDTSWRKPDNFGNEIALYIKRRD